MEEELLQSCVRNLILKHRLHTYWDENQAVIAVILLKRVWQSV